VARCQTTRVWAAQVKTRCPPELGMYIGVCMIVRTVELDAYIAMCMIVWTVELDTYIVMCIIVWTVELDTYIVMCMTYELLN
jgi:hypothetical protein